MIRTIKSAVIAVMVLGTSGAAYAAECTDDSVSAGKKVFRACTACHKVEDGKNGVGPHLFGVVGRDIGTVDGFKYSKALKTFAEEHGTWTADLINTYIEAPRKVMKGTRMAYPGLRKADKREELVCYLSSNG